MARPRVIAVLLACAAVIVLVTGTPVVAGARAPAAVSATRTVAGARAPAAVSATRIVAGDRATATVASLPTLLTSWYGRYVVRPTSIYYTGDDSGIIGKLRPHGGLRGAGRGYLHWKRWGAKRAFAVGTVWLKLGTPTATSPFTRFAATVTATRPRHGHFTRMTLRYRLYGRNVTDTRCVPDSRRVAEWSTVIVQGRCEA